MSFLRRCLVNGALLLTSLLVGFLLCELLVRLYFFGFSALHPDMALQYFRLSRVMKLSTVEDLPFELVPNEELWHAGTKIRVNSLGLRDREYTKEKPPHSVRVVVLGDSFTMPQGVDIESAYHSLLEKEFNEEGDLTYEFLNFGVSGYSLRHYTTLLHERVLAYDPDLILIGICIRNDAWLREPSIYERQGIQRFRWYSKMLWDLVSKRALSPSRELNAYLTLFQKLHVQKEMASMATFSQENDIPILLTSLEYHPSHRDGEYFFQQTAHALSLPFIPMIRHFDPTRIEDYHIFPWDGHPNAVANAVFAEVIRPRLIQEFEKL